MNKPDKAGEPSMDEILSSIRKIISEEPIGSHQGSAASAPTGAPGHGSLGDVRLGGDLLGVAADEPSSFNSTNNEPSFSLASTDVIGSTAHESSAPGMRGYEPTLPMPEKETSAASQENPEGRSPLSSRLANVLRGAAPASTPSPTPQTTFDDDDLSAALDDASLGLAPVIEPGSIAADSEQTTDLAGASVEEELESNNPSSSQDESSVSDIPLPSISGADWSSSSEKEVVKTPDPFAALGNVSVVASTESDVEPEQPTTTTAKADVADENGGAEENSFAASTVEETVHEEPSVTTPETVNGADSMRAPLFDTGPQPPSSLRPRAFSSSDITSLSDDQVNGAAAVEIPDAVSETEVFTENVTAEEMPMVIASMEKPLETSVAEPVLEPTDEAASEPEVLAADAVAVDVGDGSTPLVGLAAAVAARDNSGTGDQDLDEGSNPEIAQETPTTTEAEATDDAGPPEDVGIAPQPPIIELPPMELAAAAANEPGVTASISPAGVQTLEDTVAELLRPMLRDWLTNNMPRIVEKALRIELASSITGGADSSDTVQIENESSDEI